MILLHVSVPGVHDARQVSTGKHRWPAIVFFMLRVCDVTPGGFSAARAQNPPIVSFLSSVCSCLSGVTCTVTLTDKTHSLPHTHVEVKEKQSETHESQTCYITYFISLKKLTEMDFLASLSSSRPNVRCTVRLVTTSG